MALSTVHSETLQNKHTENDPEKRSISEEAVRQSHTIDPRSAHIDLSSYSFSTSSPGYSINEMAGIASSEIYVQMINQGINPAEALEMVELVKHYSTERAGNNPAKDPRRKNIEDDEIIEPQAQLQPQAQAQQIEQGIQNGIPEVNSINLAEPNAIQIDIPIEQKIPHEYQTSQPEVILNRDTVDPYKDLSDYNLGSGYMDRLRRTEQLLLRQEYSVSV